jgi:drug/metabolite transporter (DMT)-like permease
VTLVAASMPVWMLLVGTLFFGERSRPLQWLGASLSLAGVLTVLSRGRLDTLLEVRLVPGDLWVLLATILWAFYSWMLARPKEPAALRGDWAAFLLAQIVFGVGWSALLTVGEQWAGAPAIRWGWEAWAVLAYVAIFPSIVAYRAWSAGVGRAGPAVAAFFQNLTPVFTALLSLALLGEAPSAYHAVAFALVAGGIYVSSRPARAGR